MEELSLEEKRKKVIERCLECIKNDGYVRLGYVIETEFHLKESLPFYKAVSALLIKDGKFIREPYRNERNDFDILPNPNYEVSESVKSTNTFQRKFGNRSLLLALVSTIFILATLWMEYRNKTEQELKGLHQSLNGIQEILKDIRLSQQGMDSSLKQMQKDSLVGNKHR